MKTALTLLNSFKLLKSRAFRKDKLVPLSKIETLKPYLKTAVWLSLGRPSSQIKERFQICCKLLMFISRMSKNHGVEYTVKWLKCSTVALQKYIGGDPIRSLRVLEPHIPLPRLINGCPAFIPARDRGLMRAGNSRIVRFWLTLFNMYRVLEIPGKLKLETITGPFSGSMDRLLHTIDNARVVDFFSPFVKKGNEFRQPMAFVLSQKSSPSNAIAYRGLLTDYHILKYGTVDLNHPQSPTKEWENILKYMEVLKSARFNLLRFKQLLSSMDSIIESMKLEGLKLPSKVSMAGSGLSQFAAKQEAAGKVRIFALLDTITQSLLRPLHDFLFGILKELPNDGTFDQDAAVRRSEEKLRRYGVAYSLDLSAATDRLPARLTAAILEKITGVSGLGDAWYAVMTDREFTFAKSGAKGDAWKDDYKARYSVGQPMGGLSSWAGLAITHHWIIQFASLTLRGESCFNFENLRLTNWDERYEILGDDIVIFNRDLAEMYLVLMEALGVEINLTKSISSSLTAFEFAKRTVWRGVNVSPVSLMQLMSGRGIGARVSDAFEFARRGLINSVPSLGQFLSGSTSLTSFRRIKEVGLPALSFANLLFSKEIIELRLVLESLVNPRYEDFDFEKSKFDLPLHSLLRQSLDLIRGRMVLPDKEEIAITTDVEVKAVYPFSREGDRREFSRDYEPHLAAVILQESLAKCKTLVKDYEDLVGKGASSMYIGKASKLFQAQVQGFMMDIIIDLSDLDVSDFCDEVEDLLYNHAKYNHVSVSEALATLGRVEALIYKFTLKREISRVKFEKDSSPILTLMRKSEGHILIPYWTFPTL